MAMRLGHQIAEDLLIVTQGQRIVRADDDDQIISRREIVPEQADRFAQESFDPVAPHSVANASRHAQAPPAMGKIVLFAVERQRTARLFCRGGVNSGEGDLAAEAVGARKCIRFFGHRYFIHNSGAKPRTGNRRKHPGK